ncbi:MULTISPECIES: GNAT family N-acetyltransferase [Thalassotalea]|uniref:GNAT family N-acetyltransferase n=1 Tax=Thalassotalea castellviae TaxID=3075612 RepID=A0ABU3A172_9GAMM|nr:GNAT family N-acetyltransferase [Thalassotalea sp. W431]MDT0603690.1 GNAT family N-acetyltransferase [Thalassotalea sp. W431]
MHTYKAATIDESDLLTALMRRAKAHWGYPQEWLDEWKKELTLSPSYIAANIVVILEAEKKAIGFFGLELKDNFAYLSHLWVEPLHIGNGFGKLLLVESCKAALNRGYSTIELVADPNAENFYKLCGAKNIGEVHSEIFGTPRVLPKMRLTLNSMNKLLNNT